MSFKLGTPLQRVADALARGSTTRLLASIRSFTSRSREDGESVEDVVKQLMVLVDAATSDHVILAKRACEVATCAIDAYFQVFALPSGWRQSSGDCWAHDASRSSGL